MITLEQVLAAAMANLPRMSRTANGIVDVSASATKKDSMLIGSGDEAARRANENYANAIAYCYENRHRAFASGEDVRAFFETVASIVNSGIVKSGQLLRCGEDSRKYNYTRLANLPEEYARFCEKCRELCADPETDSVYLAAFTEYYINMRLHVFSDGCGKTAMVLGAFMRMRADELPVAYEGREAYYARGTTCIAAFGSPEDRGDFVRFLSYYKYLAEKE